MLADVVQKALDSLDVDDRDQGAAELALTYARDIDAGGELTKLGPALLACLDALHMTPRARAAVRKAAEVTGAQPASPLDELQQQRRKRRTAG